MAVGEIARVDNPGFPEDIYLSTYLEILRVQFSALRLAEKGSGNVLVLPAPVGQSGSILQEKAPAAINQASIDSRMPGTGSLAKLERGPDCGVGLIAGTPPSQWLEAVRRTERDAEKATWKAHLVD